MSRNNCLLILALLLSTGTAQAATAADKAGRDIVKTYAFDPTRMSIEDQEKKVQGLADLWSRFHDNPDDYLPAMRKLLAKQGNTEMLYCDGGMLLLDEATQPADKTLGLQSISKCSLFEIEQAGYFYTLHKEALDGTDTLELQFKMLSKPNFQVYDSLHNLTLDQDFAFVYPLLVQDESRYFNRLADRLKIEQDTTARQTLLAAIYYAATPESEKTLNTVADDKSLPPAVRLRAQVFLKRIADMRKIEPDKIYEWMKQNRFDLSTTASENDLRTARRNRMRDISHDALRELDIYTLLIYQAMKECINKTETQTM
jgi:hypothetical protein